MKTQNEPKQVKFYAPQNLLTDFDKMVAEVPEMLNRTSELLRLMAAAVKKHERQKQNDTYTKGKR